MIINSYQKESLRLLSNNPDVKGIDVVPGLNVLCVYVTYKTGNVGRFIMNSQGSLFVT